MHNLLNSQHDGLSHSTEHVRLRYMLFPRVNFSRADDGCSGAPLFGQLYLMLLVWPEAGLDNFLRAGQVRISTFCWQPSSLCENKGM